MAPVILYSTDVRRSLETVVLESVLVFIQRFPFQLRLFVNIRVYTVGQLRPLPRFLRNTALHRLHLVPHLDHQLRLLRNLLRRSSLSAQLHNFSFQQYGMLRLLVTLPLELRDLPLQLSEARIDCFVLRLRPLLHRPSVRVAGRAQRLQRTAQLGKLLPLRTGEALKLRR